MRYLQPSCADQNQVNPLFPGQCKEGVCALLLATFTAVVSLLSVGLQYLQERLDC